MTDNKSASPETPLILTPEEKEVLQCLLDLAWEVVSAIDFGDADEDGTIISAESAYKIEGVFERLSTLPDVEDGNNLTVGKAEAALRRLMRDDLVVSSPSPSSQKRPVNPADPYFRMVMFFDQDSTAGSFLNKDGEGGFVGAVSRMAREIDRLRQSPAPQDHVLGPDRPHDGPEDNDETDRNSEKSCHSQIGVVMTNPGEPPVGSLVSIRHISAPCDQNSALNTNRDDFSKDPSPEPNLRAPDTATVAAHMKDFEAFVLKTAPKLHWKVWQDLGADTSRSNGGYDGWQHGFGQALFGPLPLAQLMEEMKASVMSKVAALATTECQP